MRGLSSKAERHTALGQLLARLIETEHIKGLNDVFQATAYECDRYKHFGGH